MGRRTDAAIMGREESSEAGIVIRDERLGGGGGAGGGTGGGDAVGTRSLSRETGTMLLD